MNAAAVARQVYRAVATVGQSVTFHVKTTAGTYSPTTGNKTAATISQVSAMCSPPLEYQQDLGSTLPIRQAASSLILPSYQLTFVPTLVQSVTIGGDHWVVLEVQSHSISATVVAWELKLQKGFASEP
jgi:hypothetical protein